MMGTPQAVNRLTIPCREPWTASRSKGWRNRIRCVGHRSRKSRSTQHRGGRFQWFLLFLGLTVHRRRFSPRHCEAFCITINTKVRRSFLRFLDLHNGAYSKGSSPPPSPMTYNSQFEGAYMHQDDSVLGSSGLQDTHPSELASNTTDQSQVLNIGASASSSVRLQYFTRSYTYPVPTLGQDQFCWYHDSPG